MSYEAGGFTKLQRGSRWVLYKLLGFPSLDLRVYDFSSVVLQRLLPALFRPVSETLRRDRTLNSYFPDPCKA